LAKGLLTQYSELWAFLTALTHPDGEKRQTGSLSLSFDVDMLKLSLTDDETGQYVCLTGRDIDQLLVEAERGLCDGSLHWRRSRYAKKK
jgi:hypothetical protein